MSTAIFKVTCHSSFRQPVIVECNELRKNLIVWAQNQATGYRTQAAIGNTKKNADHNNAKADSFDFMAMYLAGMEIKE